MQKSGLHATKKAKNSVQENETEAAERMSSSEKEDWEDMVEDLATDLDAIDQAPREVLHQYHIAAREVAV